MRPEDIHEGKTYAGRSGPLRYVRYIYTDGSNPSDERERVGWDRHGKRQDHFPDGDCKVETFALWARSEVAP